MSLFRGGALQQLWNSATIQHEEECNQSLVFYAAVPILTTCFTVERRGRALVLVRELVCGFLVGAWISVWHERERRAVLEQDVPGPGLAYHDSCSDCTTPTWMK